MYSLSLACFNSFALKNKMQRGFVFGSVCKAEILVKV